MNRSSQKLRRTLAVTAVLATLFCLFPSCLADNYSASYQLLDQSDGSTYYMLNVATPQSLYDYYVAKSHALSSSNDFAKFVTPYSLQPIADSLRQIYADDEDFANGVLMIVHQIPYKETAPSKYPVETIANNEGDCDLFSFIAASIIKGDGLDVVLLYYEHEAHMNIGINLSHAPQDARSEVFYVTNNNVKYYVAECTGGNWQIGWRVGESPDETKHANAEVITLENCEHSSTGQVSASYRSLASSTLTLTTSTAFVIQGTAITLSGQLSPYLQDRNVTIYIRTNNSPWMVLDTTTTDFNGRFNCAWNVDAGGICYVRASWSGDAEYSAADSPIRTITSLSMFLVSLLALTIILVIVGIITYLVKRHGNQGIPELQPPEISP